jgi:hypothetical protein
MQKETALQVAEQQSQRTDQERKEKEAALQRADLLAAKLRELGIDPSEIIGKK